jgi:uracil-DNA glycosylase family 4
MLDRCPSCPGPSSTQVFASGPSRCPVLFLGAGPGKHENASGRPYQGPNGQEFENTYLALADFRRDEVAVSNAKLCWDGQEKLPSEKSVLDCARFHLPRLLDEVQPQVLVLMGGVTQKIADTRIRLDMHHGVPQWTSILGGTWTGWIWPSFESALGMRDTTQMTHLLTDFKNLGKWLRGEWKPVKPVEYEKDYHYISTAGDFYDYIFWHADLPGVAAMDTERHGKDSWSVQLSLTPGTGVMIRARDKDCLAECARWTREINRTIAFHNAGQDLDELDRLGIRVCRYHDTMQEAYHQCSLPQGLKALAYRTLGVTMRSWEDIVWPASIEAAITWMREAQSLATKVLYDIKHTHLKMKTCRDCGRRGKGDQCKHCGSEKMSGLKIERVPGAVEGIMKHVLRYTESTKDAEDPYDPWRKLAELKVEGLRGKKAEDWEWECIEREIGPMPILGIGNCDETEALVYAVGDADMTGQVAACLEQGRLEERWRVERNDWDQ